MLKAGVEYIIDGWGSRGVYLFTDDTAHWFLPTTELPYRLTEGLVGFAHFKLTITYNYKEYGKAAK